MAVTYNSTNRTVTFNSTSPTPNDLDDVVTAVNDTAVCENLIPEARCYKLLNTQCEFQADSNFEDSEFAFYHTKAAAWTTDRAFWWSAATGEVNWGKLDNTTPTIPIVWQDPHYYYDNLTTPGNVFWAYHTYGSMSDGTFCHYGGIFEYSPRGSTSNGQFVYFPMTKTYLIGLNFERWGGQRTWGTNYAVREVICKGGANAAPGTTSGPYGFSMGGVTTVEDAMFDIVAENNCYGYYFYAANGGTMRDARLRNNNSDLNRNSTTAALDVKLVDCDPYGDISGSGSGDIREYTSYNITCYEEDGSTPIQNVRVRVWRDNPTYEEVVNELTDANGIPVSGEMWLLLTHSNDTSYPQNQFVLGDNPYNVRVRDYGREYISVAKLPDPPVPLVDNFLMVETGLTKNGTDDTEVSGYTDIAISGTEIQVTGAHTLLEIYSWIQYYYQLSDQMVEADADIPLGTFDGATYTIISGWSMAGIATNVDLDSRLSSSDPHKFGVLVLANNNRWVPINLTGIEPDFVCSIRRQSDDFELYSVTILDDGTEEFVTKREWTPSDIDVNTRVRLQGYVMFDQPGIIGNRGLIIAINSTKDPRYEYFTGRIEQTHFRWRNDDGTEVTATWAQNEDTNHTGLVKETNIRLRIQADEFRKKPNTVTSKLQYRKVGDAIWEDVGT